MNRNLIQEKVEAIALEKARLKSDIYWTVRAVLIIAAIAVLKNYAQWQ